VLVLTMKVLQNRLFSKLGQRIRLLLEVSKSCLLKQFLEP
jgi:hypothetical protein